MIPCVVVLVLCLLVDGKNDGIFGWVARNCFCSFFCIICAAFTVLSHWLFSCAEKLILWESGTENR